MTKGPFNTHFEQMVSAYKKVSIIDLLQDKRDREVKLTKEYYKLFIDSDLKKKELLTFLHFDFHRFCKGDKFEALRVLIN